MSLSLVKTDKPRNSMDQIKSVMKTVSNHIGRKLPKMVEELRKDSSALYEDLVKQFFQHLDDTFFQLAQNAALQEDQYIYFSSLSYIRLKRQDWTEQLAEQLTDSFVLLLDIPRLSLVKVQASEELALVDQEVQELDVTIESLIRNAHERCNGELLHLRTRLEVLLPHPLDDDSVQPLDPKRMIFDFYELIEADELSIKAKLIMLKQFERSVLKQLPELLKEMNEILIQKGVLPTLSINQQQEKVLHKQDTYETKYNHIPENNPINQEAQAMKQSVVTSNLQRVLEKNSIDQLIQISNAISSQATHQFEQVVNFGDWMNGQLFSGYAQETGTSVDQELGQLKKQLPSFSACKKLQEEMNNLKLGSIPRGQLSIKSLIDNHILNDQSEMILRGLLNNNKKAENSFELINDMFAQLLEDNALPEVIALKLWRLQMPYLKLALIDTSFFVNTRHPARSLLTSLVKASVSIDEETEENDQLLGEIENIIHRIVNEFEQDIRIFFKINESFNQYWQAHSEKVELVKKRLKTAEEGKDRKSLLREQIDSIYHEKQQEIEDLPEEVQKLVNDWWQKVLNYTGLKSGIDSQSFEYCQKTLLGLLQVYEIFGQAKNNHYDAEYIKWLKANLTQIIKDIRSGLGLVGATDEDTYQVVEMIRNHYSAYHQAYSDWRSEKHNDNQAGDDASDQAEDHDIDQQPATINTINSWQDVETFLTNIKDQVRQHENELAEIDLQVGDWIDFTKVNGACVRCQLAMRLDSSRKLVFTNRFGIKILELTIQDYHQASNESRITKVNIPDFFENSLKKVIGDIQSMQHHV